MGRDRRQRRHRLVGKERQDDAGEDQEFARDRDLPDVERRASACSFSRPVSSRTTATVVPTAIQCGKASVDRAEEIGVDIEQGNDQPDIRLAGLVGLTDMLAIEDRQPGAEHQKAGGEWDEMHRIEQVEHAAGKRQHRKRADAARAPGVGAGEEILEGEAEKQAQRHKQRDARHRRRSDHGRVIMRRVIMGVTETSPWHVAAAYHT